MRKVSTIFPVDPAPIIGLLTDLVNQDHEFTDARPGAGRERGADAVSRAVTADA